MCSAETTMSQHASKHPFHVNVRLLVVTSVRVRQVLPQSCADGRYTAAGVTAQCSCWGVGLWFGMESRLRDLGSTT